MLPATGYILNITAAKTTHQPTHKECVLDCMDIQNCMSINAMQQVNNTYECQLLAGTGTRRNMLDSRNQFITIFRYFFYFK